MSLRTLRWIIALCCLSLSVLAWAFPFWLESPTGRSNPWDRQNPNNYWLLTPVLTATPLPTGTPTVTQTSTPTPTNSPSPTPTPLPTIVVRVLDKKGAAVVNAVVMLGTDTAGALNTDALGEVVFVNAVPPVDVHVFSPNSAGLPLYLPYIASVYNQTATLLILDVFRSAPLVTTAVVYDVSGTAANNDYRIYGNDLASSVSAPCLSLPCFPINRAANLELDSLVHVAVHEFTGTSLTAAYFDQGLASNPLGITFTGSTGLGFLPMTQTLNWDIPSGANQVSYATYAGTSTSDQWYLGATGTNYPTYAALPINSAAPSSATQFTFGSNLYNWGGTSLNLNGAVIQQASNVGNVTFNYNGTVIFDAVPSSGSRVLQAHVVSGSGGNVWSVAIASGVVNYWNIYMPCTACSTLNVTLPSSYPAGVPINYLPSPVTMTPFVALYDVSGFDPTQPTYFWRVTSQNYRVQVLYSGTW